MTSYIDAGSIVAGAAGLAMWQAYLGMTQNQVGMLNACSANALSAAIGALVGGRICDLVGRKLVYTYDLLFYIIGMLIIIFSGSYAMLLIGFIIVGLSVGADVAASWTLIAENAPAENRAKHCGTAQLMWALGPCVVLLLSAIFSFYLYDEVKDNRLKEVIAHEKVLQDEIKTLLAENPTATVTSQQAELTTMGAERRELAGGFLLGNRIVFAHLAIIAFIVWIMRLRMPESEEWKSNKEKEKELIEAGVWQKTSYWDLFTNKQNLRGLMLLIGVYMVWNLAAGTGGGMMPYIYKAAGGITDGQSQALTALLFGTSCFATIFIFMTLADKYSRRLIYCVIACLYIAAWGLLMLPKEFLGIGIFALASILMGINNGSGQQAFYQMWAAEMFPARYRAAAQGFSFFTARFCLSIWLFITANIIGQDGEGLPIAATILVAFAAISMLIGTIFCPDTAGKSLQQIEEERYGKVDKQ